MSRRLDEIKYDLAFLKSHTLQPKWIKVVKIFILLGFLGGYLCLIGLVKTTLFNLGTSGDILIWSKGDTNG